MTKKMLKSISLKSAMVAICLAVCGLLLCVAGCGEELKLSATNNVTSAKPGSSIQLVTDAKESDAKNVTFEITSGSDHGSVSANGLLTIKATAVPNTQIKVVAKLGKTTSNELVITVAPIELTAITATANKSQVAPGGNVILQAALTPANTTSTNITWQFVEGSNLATLQGNVLLINDNAPNASVIKVKAVCGTVSSNVLTIDVAEDALTLTAANNATSAKPGETIQFSTDAAASEAASVTYQIVAGQDAATISATGLLTINATAVPNTQVKVVAKLGKTTSNEITITVAAIPLTSIVASTNKTQVAPEGNAILGYVLNPTNTTDKNVVWQFVEGSNFATIQGNVLLINEDTAVGSIVKVKAVCGTVESNVLTITVAIDALNLSAQNGATSAKPGETIQFATDAAADDLANVTYQITVGQNLATISANGLLTINSNATPDQVVKVVAKLGNKTSNEISITITDIDLETITISSNKNFVAPGAAATLEHVLAPANTTQNVIAWQFVEGSSFASINGNVLLVNSNAPQNSVIKIKATGANGTIESNVITITVGYDDNALTLSYNQDNLTLDNDDNTASKALTVSVFDSESGMPVSNKDVTFEIVSGSDLLQISPNGYNCGLTILGHGTATVRASLTNNQDEYVDATITLIKAPEQILVPEVLRTKQSIEFAVAKNAEIKFEVEITGEKVCEEVSYTFAKYDSVNGTYIAETSAGEFGTFSAGKITFNTTGKIKVTATSASGSQKTVYAEQVFEVNNGVNVSTYEQLQSVLNSTTYAGTPVNIVVMDKTNATYGYDLVPEFILNNNQTNPQQVIDSVIFVQNGDLILNGNGYKINFSGLKYFSEAGERYSSLIKITGAENAGNTQADHYVEINNLKLEGNVSVDGKVGETNFETSMIDGNGLKGSFSRGLEIGHDNAMVSYGLKINNLEINKFSVGMRINHIIDGVVENTRINNCFSNGIESSANIITFSNMFYGACGAAGIEITPDNCATAGLNFNQNQIVKFAGDIEANNINSGNTTYFTLLSSSLGVTGGIPAVIKGSLQGYSEEVISNVVKVTQDEELFNFIALIFNDPTEQSPNTSELQYSNALQGGLIDIADITGINTTHQYIKVTIAQGLGSALLYNWNYVEQ